MATMHFVVIVQGKGGGKGGIAIYVKNKFYVTLLSSVSYVKQFELLSLNLEFSHCYGLFVIGLLQPLMRHCLLCPDILLSLSRVNSFWLVILT